MTYKIMWLESMLCPWGQSFWNSGDNYIWFELCASSKNLVHGHVIAVNAKTQLQRNELVIGTCFPIIMYVFLIKAVFPIFAEVYRSISQAQWWKKTNWPFNSTCWSNLVGSIPTELRVHSIRVMSYHAAVRARFCPRPYLISPLRSSSHKQHA